MECVIVGTGDGKLPKNVASKTIAKDIVIEIVDNALDTVDGKENEQISVAEFKERFSQEMAPNKSKPGNSLIGSRLFFLFKPALKIALIKGLGTRGARKHWRPQKHFSRILR